jgi:integrase
MATGCIRERNGRFYVRVRVLVVDPVSGLARWKQVERAAGQSRRGALRMLRGLQGQAEDGRYVPSTLTVAELGHRWLDEHVRPGLKPGAVASYEGTFYRHVAPALGAVRLDDCHPQMIRAMLGRKRAEGLGEETVAKIRRQIHAMFAFAQDAGLVSVNPADSPRARGRKQGQHRARGTQLSPMQLGRFLDVCSPRWRLFFTVALDTGLRRGELIGLRWGDIDLLQRIIYVRRSIGPYDQPAQLPQEEDGERLSTKTEAGQRLVPILDGAQQALEELYATARDTSDRASVFATIERKRGRDGVLRPTGRPLSPRMVTRVFRRYADCAGLPESVRLHDLRHTAITNAIGQGEDILLIAAFAGHAKTSTTVDVYGHLMPDRVREAARRMRSVSGAPSPLETAATAPVRPDRPAAPYARRVDSTSPRTQPPAGRAATVTMHLEHTTTQHQHTTEHRHTDQMRSYTDRIQNYNDLHPRRGQPPELPPL